MSDPRRASRPRGRTGPGRASRPGPPAGARRPERAAAPTAGTQRRPRPRFTGRALILVLVVSVLVLSSASSLQAYLQQRRNIETAKAQIAQREQRIAKLEAEKQRWEDPAFVEQQARERFGYVMPGETPYIVLDESGKRLEPEAELSDPTIEPEREAWWSQAWSSVELAGHPPKAEAPASVIDGAKQERAREKGD